MSLVSSFYYLSARCRLFVSPLPCEAAKLLRPQRCSPHDHNRRSPRGTALRSWYLIFTGILRRALPSTTSQRSAPLLTRASDMCRISRVLYQPSCGAIADDLVPDRRKWQSWAHARPLPRVPPAHDPTACHTASTHWPGRKLGYKLQRRVQHKRV